MQRDRRGFLTDILSAANSINTYVERMQFADYLASEVTRAGTQFQFEVIGEAINLLLKLHPEMAGEIREDRQFIHFRNRIIHGYFSIDDELVWSAIKTNLPGLIEEVTRLLKELSV